MYNQAGTRVVLPFRQKEFFCPRLPWNSKEALQAWDAADELLLHYVITRQFDTTDLSISSTHVARSPSSLFKPNFIQPPHHDSCPSSILLVNDQWGVLYKVLRTYYPHAHIYTWIEHASSEEVLHYISDMASFPAVPNGTQSISHLMETHACTMEQSDPLLTILHDTEHLAFHSVSKTLLFDWVLMKNPKSHAHLKFQLHIFSHHIHQNSVVLAADMSKYIHTTTLKVFKQYWHEVHTSLAVKKSTLDSSIK